MVRHIRQYVKRELFKGEQLPPATNRRFYPKLVDVRNHMYNATAKNRYSKFDQENVQDKIKIWQKENNTDMFYFRPYGATSMIPPPTSVLPDDTAEQDIEEDIAIEPANAQKSLLFVHQTAWQRRLLARYGNDLCLLDATYKTTRFAVPLFFVVVKTNVDYQVVGSFVTQGESKEIVAEALEVFSKWNPCWKPSFFMVDYCEAEINAVEEIFPDCIVYLCDFHREQAWERWVSKSANEVTSVKQKVLQMMRLVAHAGSEQLYNDAVNALQSSEVWKKNNKLREWFTGTWLAESKRWVWLHRKTEVNMFIHTNNGVERQNKDFKHYFLAARRDKSLSGMLTSLVEDFLPEKYTRYVEKNTRCHDNYRKYHESIPGYLFNRPRGFVKHCMSKLTLAEDIPAASISCIDPAMGVFNVQSSSSSTYCYRVDFGHTSQITPSCDCHDWARSRLLCKHFFAVFRHFPSWGFDNLLQSYTSRVYLTLDEEVVTCTESHHASNSSSLPSSGNSSSEVDEQPPSFIQSTSDTATSAYTLNTIRSNVLARECRETLLEAKNLTYLIRDEDVLDEFQTALLLLVATMKDKVPADGGLLLETQPKKKKLKLSLKKRPEYHVRHFPDLPKPPKRKHPFTGRVGAKAETMRKHFRVKVEVEKEEPASKVPRKDVQEIDEPINVDALFEEDPQIDFLKSPSVDRTSTAANNNEKMSPFNRIIKSRDTCQDVNEVMIEYGPVRLSAGDLWTVIPPYNLTANDIRAMKEKKEGFVPGWLSDTVIESVLWEIQSSNEHCFSADATVSQIAQYGASTQRLWSNVDFDSVTKIMIPMNPSRQHWTLLVVDKSKKVRWFLDPMTGHKERQINMTLVNSLSDIIDIKTGWDSQRWPCIEPRHYSQRDGHNCGILVCVFAKRLSEGKNLQDDIDCREERRRIASSILGSCYDDYEKRDIAVCKVCRGDDMEDWLGCDKCGQFFHASCLKLDFATAIEQTFHCP